MKWNSSSAVIFALNRYFAVVLALYAAFALDLPNPWWAMLTVFLAQPTQPLVGAIWAKAFYRVAGTIIGAIAAIVLIPNLSNSPELLILGLAAWVGACLFGALLDRTPRGHVFMLAGYTVALVYLPIATDPIRIFDTAVVRTEEIIIGVLASALVQSLLFPSNVEAIMHDKLAGIMKEARGWIGDRLRALAPAPTPQSIAIDLTELNLMATDWRFEGTFPQPARRALRALEERLVALLPLMSAIEDRLKALADADSLAPAVPPILDRIATRVAAIDTTGAEPIDDLASGIRGVAPEIGSASTWSQMLLASLAARLLELLSAWEEIRLLAAAVHAPAQQPDQNVRQLLAVARPRSLHVDRGVAVLSGLVVALTIICGGAFTLAVRWESGDLAIGFAAICCSLFATADDPTPMVRDFLAGFIIALPLALFYEFAVLPAIDGFVMLSAVLFPVIVPISLFLTQPRFFFKALATLVGFGAGLALQPSFVADLPTFMNVYIAVLVGALLALTTLSLARALPVRRVIHRILRAGWQELADLTKADAVPDREIWASRMLDRVGLLLPRLARTEASKEWEFVDALRDLRLGVSIIELHRLRTRVEDSTGRQIESVLGALGRHFQTLALGRDASLSLGVVDRLDAAMTGILQMTEPEDRNAGIIAAVGLRRGLFPKASAYKPAEEAR